MRARRGPPQLLCLLTRVSSSWPVLAQAPRRELPRVRVVATGGTISARIGGPLAAAELLALLPDVARRARAGSEPFAKTASFEPIPERSGARSPSTDGS